MLRLDRQPDWSGVNKRPCTGLGIGRLPSGLILFLHSPPTSDKTSSTCRTGGAGVISFSLHTSRLKEWVK